MNIIVHGQIFDFLSNPFNCKDIDECYRFFYDGGLVIESGFVKEMGDFKDICIKYPEFDIVDYSDFLIMPGFIDTHTHYPQTQIIGSYGKQLIDWLNDYTFHVEQLFNDKNYALSIADIFIKELLRNGTTTCMTYGTVNPVSIDAIFSAASKYNMRLIAGKVLMNRNAPPGICDTIYNARYDCESLIEKWHNCNRNSYALTPRFAITCDREELSLVGELYKKFPDTFIQTHLSENIAEIKMTMELFPDCSDYLNVYEKAGIVTDRTIFAHCIHLSDSELERIKSAGSAIAYCPTSNLFLGSGLFNMSKSNNCTEKTTIATDIGAGTSFSLLKTLNDAYKVQQLNGYPMNAFESYYKITLGAAKALQLDNKIGSFKIGNEADFVVLDYKSPLLQKSRMDYLINANKCDIEKLLFGLQILGDDRNVKATYIMGKAVFCQ